MKWMFVHAHYDDFEFTAGGTFELRRRAGGAERLVVICTDGASGHHFRSREETAGVRLAEQQTSAQIGGYRFEPLRLPDGRIPREARWEQEPDLLPALWKAIRDFEPDYLFCPPLPGSALAGIHVDHVAIAEAVRRVAYLINVPHVYLPEYPECAGDERPRKTPVILQVADSYVEEEQEYDLLVDVEPVFDAVARMSWSHQSQIREWLPWVGRHRIEPAATLDEWKVQLRERYRFRNRKLGLDTERPTEPFVVTAWGEIPSLEQLRRDIPGLTLDLNRQARLADKLARWSEDRM